MILSQRSSATNRLCDEFFPALPPDELPDGAIIINDDDSEVATPKKDGESVSVDGAAELESQNGDEGASAVKRERRSEDGESLGVEARERYSILYLSHLTYTLIHL